MSKKNKKPISLAEAAGNILAGKQDPMIPSGAQVIDTGPAVVHPLEGPKDYTAGLPKNNSIPGAGNPQEPMQPAQSPPGDQSGVTDTKDMSIPGSGNPQEQQGDLNADANGIPTPANPEDKKPKLAGIGSKNIVAEEKSDDDDDKDNDKDDDNKDDDNDNDDNGDLDKDKLNEAVAPHVDAMLSGETLTEEFKLKAKTIFGAAVFEQAKALNEQIEAKYAKRLDKAVNLVKEELSNRLDDYLSYVISEWMTENKIAIESGIRMELMEDFMAGFRTLCTEHYIDLPEEKTNLVENLQTKVAELETKLNEEIGKNAGYVKTIGKFERDALVVEAFDGCTVVQKSKLTTLAEAVKFENAEQFKAQLKILRESYSDKPATQASKVDTLEESQLDNADGKEEVTGAMAKYVNSLAKVAKK